MANPDDALLFCSICYCRHSAGATVACYANSLSKKISKWHSICYYFVWYWLSYYRNFGLLHDKPCKMNKTLQGLPLIGTLQPCSFWGRSSVNTKVPDEVTFCGQMEHFCLTKSKAHGPTWSNSWSLRGHTESDPQNRSNFYFFPFGLTWHIGNWFGTLKIWVFMVWWDKHFPFIWTAKTDLFSWFLSSFLAVGAFGCPDN